MKTIDFPNICLVGGTGAGKSTAAKLLVDLGFQRYGFAGCAEHPHSRSPRAAVAGIWGMDAINDREKLIAIANAARSVDPDVWLNGLVTAMEANEALQWRTEYVKGAPFVVDDCRFKNEFYELKGRGFVTVRIEAPEDARVERLKANGKWLDDEYLASDIEHYLDDEPTDYTITNDGSTDDLYDELVEVLLRERKRR